MHINTECCVYICGAVQVTWGWWMVVFVCVVPINEYQIHNIRMPPWKIKFEKCN